MEENNEEIIEESPEIPAEPEDDSEVVEDSDESFNVDDLKIETRDKKEETIDYGDDIDADDVKTIGTIVEKQTASVKKALQDAQDRLEIDSFVQERPEFAKYKPVILKYLQHPVYSQIPVKNIAAMVASSDLVKLGAKREREAQAKVDATKSSGNPVRRADGGTTDWSKVSKDEFENQKRRILGMQ